MARHTYNRLHLPELERAIGPELLKRIREFESNSMQYWCLRRKLGSAGPVEVAVAESQN